LVLLLVSHVFLCSSHVRARCAWGPYWQVLDMMGEMNVQPNTVTYTSLINAARHEGSREAVTIALVCGWCS